MSMRDSAHDEHDGWPMLHDGWMRDAPALMRMAHMRRMMDGHGMAWVNIDKRFDGIFGWGWGWDVMGWGWHKKAHAINMGLCGFLFIGCRIYFQ